MREKREKNQRASSYSATGEKKMEFSPLKKKEKARDADGLGGSAAKLPGAHKS